MCVNIVFELYLNIIGNSNPKKFVISMVKLNQKQSITPTSPEPLNRLLTGRHPK